MTTPDLHNTLTAHRFCDGMPQRIIDELAGMATFVELAAGSWIARQGQPADTFHLLVDGSCAVEIAAAARQPLVIATIHAGEVLGWSWMLPPHTWHFDVLAVEDSRSIAVNGAALRSACHTDHELGYEISTRLAAVIAARLEAARMQLVDVYGQP
jgi:CRP-like cAMP-binding protein